MEGKWMHTEVNESQQTWKKSTEVKKSNRSERKQAEAKKSKRKLEDVNECLMESYKWLDEKNEMYVIENGIV